MVRAGRARPLAAEANPDFDDPLADFFVPTASSRAAPARDPFEAPSVTSAEASSRDRETLISEALRQSSSSPILPTPPPGPKPTRPGPWARQHFTSHNDDQHRNLLQENGTRRSPEETASEDNQEVFNHELALESSFVYVEDEEYIPLFDEESLGNHSGEPEHQAPQGDMDFPGARQDMGTSSAKPDLPKSGNRLVSQYQSETTTISQVPGDPKATTHQQQLEIAACDEDIQGHIDEFVEESLDSDQRNIMAPDAERANSAFCSGPVPAEQKSVSGRRSDRIAADSTTHARVCNSAFLFIKPHAATRQVQEFVEKEFAANRIQILQKGQIGAEVIDRQGLVDAHYGAMASWAMHQKPNDSVVQQKALDDFRNLWYMSWEDALSQDLVFNAVDAAERLDMSLLTLAGKVSATKLGETQLKLGDGFYVAEVEDIFVVNGFYPKMRAGFTQPGTHIYWYEVIWDPSSLAWSAFQTEVVGATDPIEAEPRSLRGNILRRWISLGLDSEPDTAQNGIHASASPFEGLADKMRWLGVSLSQDPFGKLLLDAGISEEAILGWTADPVVVFEGREQSVFDLLKDLDVEACVDKARRIAAAACGENVSETPAAEEKIIGGMTAARKFGSLERISEGISCARLSPKAKQKVVADFLAADKASRSDVVVAAAQSIVKEAYERTVALILANQQDSISRSDVDDSGNLGSAAELEQLPSMKPSGEPVSHSGPAEHPVARTSAPEKPADTTHRKAAERIVSERPVSTKGEVSNAGGVAEHPMARTMPALEKPADTHHKLAAESSAAERPVSTKSELPPLTGRLFTPRKNTHSSSLKALFEPPSEEEVFSDEALRERAQKILERSMQYLNENAPRATQYTLLPRANKPMLGSQTAEAQENLMRVARYEADDWLRKVRQRYQWELKASKRQKYLFAQLAKWQDKKQQEEALEQQLQQESERERAEKHKLALAGWKKHREYLKNKVADWANEKEGRESKQARAEIEAKRLEEETKKIREAEYRKKRKQLLEQWHKSREKQKQQEAEKRHLQEQEQQQAESKPEIKVKVSKKRRKSEHRQKQQQLEKREERRNEHKLPDAKQKALRPGTVS